MSNQTIITWSAFHEDCRILARSFNPAAIDNWSGVYGIPTGGCFVALGVATVLGIPVLDQPDSKTLIVDDLVDSGQTMNRYPHEGYLKAALYRKPHSPNGVHTIREIDGWVKFPWETDHGPEDAVVRLLQWIGEDPKRDGLVETPKRVVKALREMTVGYREDSEAILGKVFDEPYDEMVVLKGIPFTSLCEHHMLVFSGTVDVGYIPGKVVGLSKLARLVDCFSQRLQVQERLTRQVAESVEKFLDARGVAVVVKAGHSCMSCRGVKKSGATMVTSCMLGQLRDEVAARAEFLSLCRE